MTPNEIHNKQFDKAMSGYRPDDVHAFLTEIANYVESLLEEKSVLEQKMMVLADKLEEYREDEDSLRAALIGAQKLGDSVVRESKRKAEQILQEAQQKADSVVSDIKHNINRETDVLNKMQAEVARFRSQILAVYRQHIEMFNAIPYDEKDFPLLKQQQEQTVKPAERPPKPAEPPVKSAAATIKKEQPVPIAELPKAPPAPAAEAGKKEFTINFDEDVSFEEVPDESPKRESRHGDLMFGEKYPLTRKE